MPRFVKSLAATAATILVTVALATGCNDKGTHCFESPDLEVK